MGNVKVNPTSSPGIYRDELEHAETASMSSAMHLSDIAYEVEEAPLTPTSSNFPDDDLPAYTDITHLPSATGGIPERSYLRAPPIPESRHFGNDGDVVCTFPRLSQDPSLLEAMIQEQAQYPPNFCLRLRGTHTETFKTRDQKTEKKTITDFDIRLNMTHLLVCPNPVHARDPSPCSLPPQPRSSVLYEPPQEVPGPTCRYIEVLSTGQKGYRGTVVKCHCPSSSANVEAPTTLTSWCDAYVSDPRSVKAFTFRRKILNHEAHMMESLCRDLILKTSYRGHINISFPTTQSSITVYSPCHLNAWRFNPYLRWFCYLTFLWLITWPILFFVTKRYEVVTAVFPYRPTKTSRPLVQDEAAFIEDWKQALTRAVLAQHQGWIDGVYREETAQMVAAGNPMVTVRSSGSGGTMLGLAGSAIRVALNVPVSTGWGADS